MRITGPSRLHRLDNFRTHHREKNIVDGSLGIVPDKVGLLRIVDDDPTGAKIVQCRLMIKPQRSGRSRLRVATIAIVAE